MIEIKQIKTGKRVLTVSDDRGLGCPVGHVESYIEVSDCAECIPPENTLDVLVFGVNYSGIITSSNTNLTKSIALGDIKPDRQISKRGLVTYDYTILLVAKPGEDYERFNPSISQPEFK